MLLAIDTSTGTAGLALFDGEVRAELSWVAGRQHSSQLLPALERLLALAGVETGQLSAVAAARGPGSYTGVRVGLAVAQGLALALGVPAFGICSLDVVAAGQEGTALPIRPLLDAGRRRYATALYRWSADRLERCEPIVGVGLDQLEELVRQPCLLCGDLDSAARSRLRAILGAQAAIASPAASWRRPAILAQLAWAGFQAGAPGDPAALEPIYLGN